MSSHRTIHYGLRPAKNIERKMICEALQRLAHFGNLRTYRYVGFGSRYFTDFTLVHKTLGIHQMVSIEQDGTNEDWFEFNRPYKCITPIYKPSNVVLPTLDWTMPSILWLDDDKKLSTSVFSDILSFCTSAVAGSLLLITVNADAGQFSSNVDDGQPSLFEIRLQELREEVGEDRIPSGIKLTDLGKKDKPKLYRKIIDNEIREKLSIRNGGLQAEQKLNYQQLFNFVYEDGAQMLTVGGIIYTNDQTPLLEKCAFTNFDYVMSDEQAYKIEVPNLTFREIHYLNQHLPLAGDPPTSFIPAKEVNQYARIYRYFPTFTEAEI